MGLKPSMAIRRCHKDGWYPSVFSSENITFEVRCTWINHSTSQLPKKQKCNILQMSIQYQCWLVLSPHLKKIRVHQLGWRLSIPNCFWKNHPVMFQSPTRMSSPQPSLSVLSCGSDLETEARRPSSRSRTGSATASDPTLNKARTSGQR